MARLGERVSGEKKTIVKGVLSTICETGAGEACEGEDGGELHVDFLEAAGY
jgi:hypothetical protein